MNRIRIASLALLVALAFAPLLLQAQGRPPSGGGAARNLQAQVEALTARVTELEADLAAESAARVAGDGTLSANITSEANTRAAADTELDGRVDKLEGNITEADLVGTYRITGLSTDLDGNNTTAEIDTFSFFGTVTLAADHTATLELQGTRIGLAGPPWTTEVEPFPAEPDAITWSYANGLLHITDGTVNLDINLNVGAGGRVLTYADLSDDDTNDLIIGVRLQ